ncbi:mesoderm induction early response protein 2-like [Huso huso]|uniref:Mesoderm induction early response protein 2-like n=1 Tax=Huso huso TaxID=61971 RepID=A0ABR0Y4V6_HUSHU
MQGFQSWRGQWGHGPPLCGESHALTLCAFSFVSPLKTSVRRQSPRVALYRTRNPCPVQNGLQTAGAGSMGSDEHGFNLAEILSHSYGSREHQEECEAQRPLEELEKSLHGSEGSEMPLEELLALYGYEASDPISEHDSEGHDLPHSLPDMTLDKEQIAKDLLSGEEEEEAQSSADDLTPSVTSHDASDLFPHPLHANSIVDEDKDSSSSSSEEESEDDSVPSNECRKDIMVGPQYQAMIPPLILYMHQERAYESEDQLLWDPQVLPEGEVERFLRRAERRSCEEASLESLQEETLVRDNEQALYELVKCHFNTEEALRRLRFNVKVIRDELCAWSEDECRNFEHGYRVHGKNFHLIQANKVRTRSVGECVEYYYMWKKSDRYEYFTQQTKFGRKKFSLHPETIDDGDQDMDAGEGDGASHSRSSPSTPVPSTTSQLDSQFLQDPLHLGATDEERQESREFIIEGNASETNNEEEEEEEEEEREPLYRLSQPPSAASSTDCPYSSPTTEPSAGQPSRRPASTSQELNLPDSVFYQLQLDPFATHTPEPPTDLAAAAKRLQVGFSLPESFPAEPSRPVSPAMTTGQVSVSLTTDFGPISVSDVNSFLSGQVPMCPPSTVQQSEPLSQ